MVSAANRRDEYRAFYDGETWRDVRGLFCVNSPTTHRPLVVIDPEDREQVERLMAPLLARGASVGVIPARQGRIDWDAELVSATQAALRSLLTPPKPEEPTGLGAVVEDAEGEVWVQFDSKTGRWWRNHQGINSRWSALTAVKVLSPGWSK